MLIHKTIVEQHRDKKGDVLFHSIRVILNLSLDDIEEIQGYIAAEANHTKNKKLQKELGRIFDKLQVYLDIYDDQSE
jgi:hypothetical protein